MNTEMERALEWDDTLCTDGRDLITLPEGDYSFTITDFERARYPGSEKIPACSKAALTAAVDTEEGKVLVHFDLILWSTLEWKLAQFFRCIGMKEHGKDMKMDWTKVKGRQGRAHIRPRRYTDRYGQERTANELERFLDYDPAFFAGKSSGEDQLGQFDSVDTPVAADLLTRKQVFDRAGWVEEAEKAAEQELLWQQETF